MLKFFRRIRRQLLLRKQMGNYLIYAFGEIILVVIGILIALQINGWNQKRLDKKQEAQVLNRFITDLERDLNIIREARNSHEQRLIISQMVIGLIKETPDTVLIKTKEYQTAKMNQPQISDWMPATFGELLFKTLIITQFNTSKASFDELKSTGKLDIIRNTDLKVALQEYYPKAEDFQKFQDGLFLDVQMNYRDAMTKNGISSLNRSSSEKLISELKDPKFLAVSLENFAVITGASLRILVYDPESIETTAKNLINKIEEELKEHHGM